MIDHRKKFDEWISRPPMEKDVTRNPDDAMLTPWPGQYQDYAVQLAWEAWEAATEVENSVETKECQLCGICGDLHRCADCRSWFCDECGGWCHAENDPPNGDWFCEECQEEAEEAQ